MEISRVQVADEGGGRKYSREKRLRDTRDSLEVYNRLGSRILCAHDLDENILLCFVDFGVSIWRHEAAVIRKLGREGLKA